MGIWDTVPGFINDMFVALATASFIISMAQKRLYAKDPIQSQNIGTRFFESPYLMHLGRISYSLYLTHSNIGLLLRSVSGHMPPLLFSFAVWILGVGLSLMLADIFYSLFEKPFLALRSRAGAILK
jgi:peptidoglycan/LPS O-acetylase OafA/YrhL